MVQPRWTYASQRGLTQWYGHVDYYGPYVVGQWFALDAKTGEEYWSRRFSRPNTICGVTCDVIIASEMRSDGPWTVDFGIYGVCAKTGGLLWTNHGRGILGKLLRYFDFVPGFTNGFRDAPEKLVGEHVVTRLGRTLDARTGHKLKSVEVKVEKDRRCPALQPCEDHCLPLGNGSTLKVGREGDVFSIRSVSRNGSESWRFVPTERSLHVDGNSYSYRLHGSKVYIILGDAPKYLPIGRGRVKPNPAGYQIGVLDVMSGECRLHPLVHAERRTECRIEAICDHRMLVSCDGKLLTEYEIAT